MKEKGITVSVLMKFSVTCPVHVVTGDNTNKLMHCE